MSDMIHEMVKEGQEVKYSISSDDRQRGGGEIEGSSCINLLKIRWGGGRQVLTAKLTPNFP